jgi:hypothetical protein
MQALARFSWTGPYRLNKMDLPSPPPYESA